LPYILLFLRGLKKPKLRTLALMLRVWNLSNTCRELLAFNISLAFGCLGLVLAIFDCKLSTLFLS